jgi:ribose 5-phosphate isomerase A
MSKQAGKYLAEKRLAGIRAAQELADGMVVGLGSGSTAMLALDAIAARMAKGLRIAGIPTSQATADRAKALAIPLTDFSRHPRIDVTIDGADQVACGTLDLVKGLGGALLREKIVASASARMIVVVDETKLVDRLGGATPLPIEIVPFGWETTMARLTALGVSPSLRLSGGTPFISDGGHYIADCAIPEIPDPAALEKRLAGTLGVIATGLFIGLATKIVVGQEAGTTKVIELPPLAT